MKVLWRSLTVVLAITIVAGMFAPAARADCGSYVKRGKTGAAVVPRAWDGRYGTLLPISDPSTDGIVGMWHVTFQAEGNPWGPPDDTVIDNAIVVWHRDGTEIMNSARPPQDGQICLGVWEKVGKSKYKLNHFAWAGNDTSNAPSGIGDPAGPTHIVAEVTLCADGKHYSGKFTLDAYDTAGNSTAHIVGKVTATRITVHTKVSDLL